MDCFQVEITSKETIKPSTATPSHLRSYKFCLLDHLFQLIYTPQVLFYETPADHFDILVAHLKQSLLRALSLFHPLSGRLTSDESSIDCNDKGISFIEARAKGSLLTFLESPNRLDLLRHFIPQDICDNTNTNGTSSSGSSGPSGVTELIPFVVQITTFECGGLAIGYQWLHKILDGVSWGNFLKTWATLASGNNKDVIPPDFATASSLFPPSSQDAYVTSKGERSVIHQPYDHNIQKGSGCIIRAFGLSPHSIAALQDEARNQHVPQPTRVEAVSGFIWKHAIAAASDSSKSKSKRLEPAPSALIHAVDIRPWLKPPLPPTVIGNLVIPAIAYWDNSAKKPASVELQDLVEKIQRCIAEAKNHKFLSQFQGKQGGPFLYRHRQKLRSMIDNVNMNSYKLSNWNRSRPGLNADLGFGVPVWVGFIGGRFGSILRNSVILIETMEKGIEAWLVLDEDEMEVLQLDSEFLAFASPVN